MTIEEIESLLYVKHPNPPTHLNQVNMLAAQPDKFDFLVLFFNYGNASYRYMSLAQGEATYEDFEEWLEGLPQNISLVFRAEGFEKAKTALPFRRYVLERRDMGMDAYIQQLLKPEDLERWNSYRKQPNATGDSQS